MIRVKQLVHLQEDLIGSEGPRQDSHKLTHDLGLDRSEAPGMGKLLQLPALPRKRLMAQKGLRGVYQGLIGCADPVERPTWKDIEGFVVQ